MVFSIEGGVDLLSDGKKADAQVSKLLQCVDELLGRAREAVEFPDQDGIRFPNTYACHNRSSSGRSRVAPLTWLPKASVAGIGPQWLELHPDLGGAWRPGRKGSARPYHRHSKELLVILTALS
jgi:hypothetical protein